MMPGAPGADRTPGVRPQVKSTRWHCSHVLEQGRAVLTSNVCCNARMPYIASNSRDRGRSAKTPGESILELLAQRRAPRQARAILETKAPRK